MLLKTGTAPLFVSSLSWRLLHIHSEGSQLPRVSCPMERPEWQGTKDNLLPQPIQNWDLQSNSLQGAENPANNFMGGLEADPPLVKQSDEITAPDCTLIVTCWRLLLKATELEVHLLGKQITKERQRKAKQRKTDNKPGCSENFHLTLSLKHLLFPTKNTIYSIFTTKVQKFWYSNSDITKETSPPNGWTWANFNCLLKNLIWSQQKKWFERRKSFLCQWAGYKSRAE